MSKKILIITVGVTDKVVTTIQYFQPERIIFICSDGENGTKHQIENNYQSYYSKKIKTSIIEQINWKNRSQDYEIKLLQNPDDLEECYKVCSETILWVKKSFSNHIIYADYSSGTKNMSVGLAIAAIENGITLQSLTTRNLSPQFQRNLRLQKPILPFLKTSSSQPSAKDCISAFRVGNFKAFSDIQHIPIRPLTLIYGANSSGKSSILHSLLLAHHAIKNKGELDVYRTEAGGDSVDLGGFGQYVYKRDRASQVQFAVDLNSEKLNLSNIGLPNLLQDTKKLTLGVGIGTRPLGKGRVRVRSFYLEADRQEIFSMSSRPQGRLQLDNLNVQHSIIQGLLQSIIDLELPSTNTTPTDLQDIINQLVPKITAKASRFFPKSLQVEEGNRVSPQKISKLATDKVDKICQFFPDQLNQLIEAITNTIETEILQLRYLGPFRTYPPRHFAFSRQQDDNWDSGGGYAWDILLKDSQVRQKVNAWLEDSDRMNTPYKIEVRRLIPNLELTKELFPRLDRSLQDLTTRLIFHAASWGNEIQEEIERMIADFEEAGIDEMRGDRILPEVEQLVSMFSEDTESLTENWIKEISETSDPISDLVLIDQRSKTPVTHRDVGIGVSQVIPILVSCYGLSDSLIAIEQPELHLHPKLQAELGDVFIESALGQKKNRFILETHSEHLLLRIMRRMRETYNQELPEGLPFITPEDVSIIFVDPDSEGSLVMEMPLNKKGELKKAWPGGFFEEGLKEVFS